MTPEGGRLDRHLRATIAELSGRHTEKDKSMRGIQRLANASGTLMKKADDMADAAAAKLEAAYAKHVDVARRYEAFAEDVSKKAEEALDHLNQLSNLPTQDSGGSGTSKTSE
ncbi:MAG: hypothetical protein J0H40_17760 [Rhizobiales bacterium]|nr:hypothetical protein [Hyphomicrobiales bacterium]